MSTVHRWIAGNDTGTSSKAIWAHMITGTATSEHGFNVGHPHDPDDFGRCYRLLQLAPEWVARLGEMGLYSDEWAALAAHWSELTAMYEACLPLTERGRLRDCTAMYRTMREILDAARVCTDCGKVGMSGWTTYPNRIKRCSPCAKTHAHTAKGTAKSTTVEIGTATMEFNV